MDGVSALALPGKEHASWEAVCGDYVPWKAQSTWAFKKENNSDMATSKLTAIHATRDVKCRCLGRRTEELFYAEQQNKPWVCITCVLKAQGSRPLTPCIQSEQCCRRAWQLWGCGGRPITGRRVLALGLTQWNQLSPQPGQRGDLGRGCCSLGACLTQLLYH